MSGIFKRIFGADWHTFSERGNRVYLTALLGTKTPRETDEELYGALNELADGDREALVQALEGVSDGPAAHFRHDRARRVLTALVTGEAIRPPPEGLVSLYRDEQRLSEMTLTDGLRELIARAPELESALDGLAALQITRPMPRGERARHKYISELNESIEQVVGPGSRAADPLVRSPVARTVAIQGMHERLGITI